MKKREDLTKDQFLGGKLTLFQPRSGYRANIDSVLLASAIQAKAGQSVLELGCGIGAVMLCLMTRVPGLKVTGIEMQEKYAKLARFNSRFNNLPLKVLRCDITNLPIEAKTQVFDYVVLNPPFNPVFNQSHATENEKYLSKNEGTPNLSGWLDIAITRCKPRGELVIIHKVERLAQILNSISCRIGDIKILPLTSFKNQKAKRILIKGCKGTRGPLVLLPPQVLHKKHVRPGYETTYSKEIEKVLRKGKKLNF